MRSKLWAEFMKELVKIALKKCKKMPGLHIFIGYIFYQKLNNKYRALYELSKAQKYEPNLTIHFAVYRLSKNIEFDLLNEDEKLAEDRGVDYNSLVHFNDAFAIFQKYIVKACRYHKKLFEEVEEKAPDIFRIYKYGNKLIKEKLIIKKKFEELCGISPNHTKSLKLYSKFLDVVLNDADTAFSLLEKYLYINHRSLQIANKQLDSLKSSTELIKEKYEINSQTAIIVASGDTQKLGVILSLNNLVEILYGFTDKDLVGHNVGKMVPDALKSEHEDRIKDFFEREDETRPLLTTERTVYVKNQKNFLVPSSIMLKTMPEISGYVKMVAFITPLEKLNRGAYEEYQTGMLIENQNGGILHGITESCELNYGIARSKIFGKKNDEFRLNKVFVDLFKEGSYQFGMEVEVEAKLDTTALKRELGDDDDDQSFDIGVDNVIDIMDKNSVTLHDESQNDIYKVCNVIVRAKPFPNNSKLFFLTIKNTKTLLDQEMADLNADKGDLMNESFKDEKDRVREPGTPGNRNEIPEDKRKMQEFFTSIKDKVLPRKVKTVVRLYVLSIVCILVIAGKSA